MAAKKEKKPMTKKESVFKYLNTHKSGLTKAVAEEKLGVKNLSSVINTLRKEGNDIVCEKVTPKNKPAYFTYKLVK